MTTHSPTIASLFRNVCAKYSERTAVVHDGRRWTYAQWGDRVARLAAVFSARGVVQGARVAILLKTSEATAAAYMACQLLGAVAVPMNFRLSGGEAAYIVQDCQAMLLVFDASVEEAVQRVLQVQPQLLCLRAGVPGKLEAEDLEKAIAASAPWQATEEFPASAYAALVYTSGTTGRPKGVIHTHANDVAIAFNCTMEYRLCPEDVALHIAPLYHVGGMQAWFLPHLLVGAANVIANRYAPGLTLAEIAGERVSTLFAVPTQIQDMLLHPEFRHHDHSSLRLITTGGAALPAATMERVVNEFCEGIYNGYGMTEASLTLLLHPRDALARLGSCGKPSMVSECQLRGPDGNVVALAGDGVGEVGAVGELWVRGPQMTQGYWNQPEQTAQRLRGGWLQTGDLFSRDAEGYYFFRGRADDMIVTGGENVYPREVEELLYRCPGVQEAAVVGLPDAKWGQAVSAFIVRKDTGLDAATVDAFCRASGELAAFKRPRRIEFLDVLPMNPSGKVLKRELLAQYGQPEKTT